MQKLGNKLFFPSGLTNKHFFHVNLSHKQFFQVNLRNKHFFPEILWRPLTLPPPPSSIC